MMQNGYYARGYVWPGYEQEVLAPGLNAPKAAPAPKRADDGAGYCRSAIQDFYARRMVGWSVESRGDKS
jgi:hypothetical protein